MKKLNLIKKQVSSLFVNDRGAVLIEYGFISAILVVSLAIVVPKLKDETTVLFNRAVSELRVISDPTSFEPIKDDFGSLDPSRGIIGNPNQNYGASFREYNGWTPDNKGHGWEIEIHRNGRNGLNGPGDETWLDLASTDHPVTPDNPGGDNMSISKKFSDLEPDTNYEITILAADRRNSGKFEVLVDGEVVGTADPDSRDSWQAFNFKFKSNGDGAPVITLREIGDPSTPTKEGYGTSIHSLEITRAKV